MSKTNYPSSFNGTSRQCQRHFVKSSENRRSATPRLLTNYNTGNLCFMSLTSEILKIFSEKLHHRRRLITNRWHGVLISCPHRGCRTKSSWRNNSHGSHTIATFTLDREKANWYITCINSSKLSCKLLPSVVLRYN